MTAGRFVSVLCGSALVFGVQVFDPVRVSGQTQDIFDAGQEREAVYPVYEGYTRNEDGSLTLLFAYFSHNTTPVTIPLGPANAFSPGPPDRGQPITFLPGHHRWQCVMVVEPEFDGKLQWSLSHAGATRETSTAMLQYNWELSERDLGPALRAIEDPTAVSRDVCINRPPLVRVLGHGGRRGPQELQASIGEPLKLFGSVRDEGLPRDGQVTSMWSVQSGPGAVRFDDPTAPRTRAVFDQPGEYGLELSATDATLQSTIEVLVVVSP